MVGINGVHETYSMHSAINNRPASSKKVAEEPALPRETSGQDQVVISPEASFRVKLEAASKQVSSAAQLQRPTATGRMDELKNQYAGDKCPVSGLDIAQAMLSRSCGIAAAVEANR